MTAPASKSALPRSRRERECSQCGRPYCAVSRDVVFCRTECGDAWRAAELRRADRERRQAAKAAHARLTPAKRAADRDLLGTRRAERRELLDRLKRKAERQHTAERKGGI